MINSLNIRNFQSHRKTELNFSPGLNVIMGRSDSGKTAIIRALRWLIWNRPGGDSFRSTWGGNTKVEIVLENGTVISRGKGKENNYILNDTVFTAFSTDIPEEIKQALNIDEINLQSQFDRPFLLDKSAGEVASHFNKIANLDQIDFSIKKVQGFIKAIEKDINVKETIIEQSNKDLLLYKHLEKMEIDVEVLEGMETQINQHRSTSSKLITHINYIKSCTEEIDKASVILELEDSLTLLLDLWVEKEEQERIKGNLEKSIEIITGVGKKIKDKKGLLLLESDIDLLLSLYTQKKKELGNKENLEDLILAVKQAESSIKTKQGYLSTQRDKFEANFPDICPLCGTNIKERTHD